MSDLADDFRAMTERKNAKRKSNTIRSTRILDDLKIGYQSHNNGAHLIIRYQGRTIDFWPSTGKWQNRYMTDKTVHRGIFPLLNSLGIETKKGSYGNRITVS